jgi:hypothetical protein
MGELNSGGYISSRSQCDSGLVGTSLTLHQDSIFLRSVLRIPD